MGKLQQGQEQAEAEPPMQTVNFQCGHCGGLMGVGIEYLGHQVRCPHCQQVVVAPSSPDPAPEPAATSIPTPAPVPVPENIFPGIQASEDIFNQPGETDDALFGAAPKLEIPREPPRFTGPAPIFEPARKPEIPLTTEVPQPTPQSVSPFEQSATGSASSDHAGWHPTSAAPPVDPGPGHSEAHETPSTESSLPASLTRRAREGNKGIGLFIPLVFIPVVLYAILATAIAGYLYMQAQLRPKSPFDAIPDVGGDNPGVRTDNSQTLQFSKKDALQPLPDHLRVNLQETLSIGDLEVTPTRVERRKVAMFAEGAEESPVVSEYEALVLNLRVKNTAKDYSFTPLDNYFDRNCKSTSGAVPLTLVQVGSQTFFGGPAKWYPKKRRSADSRREWLQGRKNDDPVGLRPGQTLDTYVCTDAWDPAIQRYLFGLDKQGNPAAKPYQGKLLYRVQVRRGVIDHKGQPRSATAVIGVEFTDKDIRKGTSPS